MEYKRRKVSGEYVQRRQQSRANQTSTPQSKPEPKKHSKAESDYDEFREIRAAYESHSQSKREQLTELLSAAKNRLGRIYRSVLASRARQVFVVAVVVFVLALSAVLFTGSSSPDLDVASIDNEAQKPNFTVVKPADVSLDKDVLFDPNEGVATFEDEIDGISVAVSQQPLTTAQLNNKDDELRQISAGLEASSVFQTQYGDAYVAEPSELTAQAQVVLFMTDQLFIIIRTSGDKISLNSWANYINSSG